MDNETNTTRLFWNRAAADWDTQVGDDGDSNRILNSDPVLWRFAGDVAGCTVLDAGCGTGYLSRKLHERGARVIGVDFSEEMIRIANSKPTSIDYRVDSCSELKTVQDESVNLIVTNYVLMDTPNLVGTMSAFFRVLRPGGSVVAVFSHPCFPVSHATEVGDGGTSYQWPFPYFRQQKCVAPPWGHFTSEFIWFHRSLSDYWKAFVETGFQVVDFEEPRITVERSHLAGTLRKLDNGKNQPLSVAFKLQK